MRLLLNLENVFKTFCFCQIPGLQQGRPEVVAVFIDAVVRQVFVYQAFDALPCEEPLKGFIGICCFA